MNIKEKLDYIGESITIEKDKFNDINEEYKNIILYLRENGIPFEGIDHIRQTIIKWYNQIIKINEMQEQINKLSKQIEKERQGF